MLPAAERLRAALASVTISVPRTTVFGVDVRQHTGADAIRAGLVKQLHTPVYWAATVRTMIGAGATQLVECGPGKVLTSLNRRVDRNRSLVMLALEDPKSLQEALTAVTGGAGTGS
jgi:[acyl-carrier-protein] S-malonyltransferase